MDPWESNDSFYRIFTQQFVVMFHIIPLTPLVEGPGQPQMNWPAKLARFGVCNFNPKPRSVINK